MVGAVAYEDGFLSLGLALWYGLLAVTYAGLGRACLHAQPAREPRP